VIGTRVVAGRNLEIRQGTTLGGSAGKCRQGDPMWTQPRLGDDVVIGCHAAILGPLKIGHGAVVGACALLLCDADSAGTYVGVPARRIR
jgi:serine O-acetyltransferase